MKTLLKIDLSDEFLLKILVDLKKKQKILKKQKNVKIKIIEIKLKNNFFF